VPAVLLLHYYYDNYNTLSCLQCDYYTTTFTTDMPAVMPVVLLEHYYYDNYNSLSCSPCYN